MARAGGRQVACGAVLLYIFAGIQGTNSQTETTNQKDTVITTIEYDNTTDAYTARDVTETPNTETYPIEVNTTRQSRSSIDDVSMDGDENHKSNEQIKAEFTSRDEPVRGLESASKIQGNTIYEVRNKLRNVSSDKNVPIKQPIKEIDEELLRRIVATKLSKAEEKNAALRAHVRYDEVTGELIGGDHPCHRECREGEEPMICYYHFNVEWYQTMSKACYDCPFNISDCYLPDCIPGDGMNRPLNVVNRKMPGPAIEICHNDRVIVDVENDLMTEATTVHWHGQHQKGTPYMDGTPFVTQCPILPGSTFRYQFNATHAGTHFWHSHSGMQRADGAAGVFIVRRPRSQDRHASLYDYDRSEHVMLVTDWVHELSVTLFTDHHHSTGDNKPPSLLINGLGRFNVFSNITAKPLFMRAARFNVEQGYKYRFRIINAEFLNCPIELSVDGHNITVIASDGYDLEPITATSLVTYAGERYDFILEANNEIDNYWIRFRGLMDCDERFTKAKQVAVLHYEGAMEDEPPGHLTWEESHNEGLQLNALNKGEEENETISVAEMRSLQGYDESLREVADYQFYIAYDFYAKNNSHFHRSPYYGFYQVPKKTNRLYTPQLNHISMKMPTSPLLLDRPSPDKFCNSSSIDASCKEDYCQCSHVLSVRTGSVVELIILDEGVTFDANHPFHLHGHAFRVVGMRRLSNVTTIEDVKAFDEAGLLKRNLKNAPLKDTVTVPDGGYTVLRFKADNPGYWLFHCHIEFHVEVGMALVFKVGEHREMAPIPPEFPRCGSYLPDNMLEHVTTEKPVTDSSIISISHWWPVVMVSGNSGSAITNSFVIIKVVMSIWVLKGLNVV